MFISVETLYNHAGHDISINTADIDRYIGLVCENCSAILESAPIEHKHTVTLTSNTCEDCGELI
jgi:hypothetical protein